MGARPQAGTHLEEVEEDRLEEEEARLEVVFQEASQDQEDSQLGEALAQEEMGNWEVTRLENSMVIAPLRTPL